jgi:hypothetical protein
LIVSPTPEDQAWFFWRPDELDAGLLERALKIDECLRPTLRNAV